MTIVHTTSLFPCSDTDTGRRTAIARLTWAAVYERHPGRVLGVHQPIERAPRTSRQKLKDDRSLPFIKDLLGFGLAAAANRGGEAAVMLTNADTCFIPSMIQSVFDGLDRHGCYFSLRYEHRRFESPLSDETACRAPIFAGADLFAMTESWWRAHRHDYPDMLLGAEAWDGVLKTLMMLDGFEPGSPAVYHQTHAAYWAQHLLTTPSQIYNRDLARRWIERHGVRSFLCEPRVTTARPAQATAGPTPPLFGDQPVDRSRSAAHPTPGRPDASVLTEDNTDRTMKGGLGLLGSGKLEEAERWFRNAVGSQPNESLYWAFLADVLMRRGDARGATDACQRALRLDPKLRAGHNVLGAIAMDSGQLDTAVKSFERAIALGPEHPEPHVNLGMALLMSGNFKRGWPEHEWRLKLPNPIHARQGRRWDGSDPFGQTLLVYADGGIGDTAQFVRFIPMLRDRGARVIVESLPEMMPLLSGVPGVWKAVPRGGSLPHYDAYCSMVSLPALMGIELPTIPAPIPYLRPDGERAEAWRGVVQQVPGFRIGVCWRSDPRAVLLQDRSFDPAQLHALARIDGVSLISLQYREPPPVGSPIKILAGLDTNSMQLDDVVAVMENLDLIISCDTGLAHLAGAIGRPAWVALKESACWRWLVAREDSPWYPTMRLFRQDRKGDWAGVFSRMAEALPAQVSQAALVPS